MAGAPIIAAGTPKRGRAPGPSRPLVRGALIGVAVLFLTLFIVLPVANVFAQAFSKGVSGYLQTFDISYAGPEPARVAERRRYTAKKQQVDKTWAAIRMSAGVAAVVVPLNIVFGLAAAWAVTRFRFRGRTLLVALIDLPFSVSPVVAGLLFVLLLGRGGLFAPWSLDVSWPDPASLTWRGFGAAGGPLGFAEYNQGVVFTPLATVLASAFVTFPFVARAVIPLMQAQGADEEVAALSLGASGARTFRTVTLPNIRWALLYGVVLCTARAFGEFGAVSVVSGGVDGNDTMPLRIEKLWNEYDNQAAFAVSSLLALLAVVTLLVKLAVDLRAAAAARGGRAGGSRDPRA